jgi:hypothetical protein
MEDTMRPTTATDDKVIDFNALLHPGTVFEHPRDILADPSLSISEKRVILASWASDASAIASCPSLRAPVELKAPVTIDEILEALCELDGGPRNAPGGKPNRLCSTSRLLAAWRGDAMDNIALPRDVLNRTERRRMAKFSQTSFCRPPSTLGDDPLRSPRLRRLLKGSLRPPIRAERMEMSRAGRSH